MTFDIALTLFILIVAIILFATERIRADLVALLVLLALLLTGLVTVEEAFSGFSNPAVITVWAIYIVSASLTHTGIADYMGKYLGKVAGTGETRLIFVLMLAVGGMSAFMNNIGAAAVMLPVTVALGKRANVPISKLLIPLAFGSLLGGITTLIGTPPNLLTSAALLEAGLEPFSLFDFTPLGLIILFSSVIYMLLIGRRLLPGYSATHVHSEDLVQEYQLRDYLAEVHVLPNSPYIGKTFSETQLGEKAGLTIMGLQRNGQSSFGPIHNIHIESGDILFVEGQHERILMLEETGGITILPETIRDADLKSPEATVAEIVVSQLARFIGQNIDEMNFRSRYGLTVLAIWRNEEPIVGRLSEVPLQLGDTLLVHGRRERIEDLRDDNAFLLLRPPEGPSPRLHKAPINLIIFVSMISLVAFGVLHIATAAVLGAAISVLTGCLTMDEAYKSVEWKSVFLIAGMLPLGIAMETTGTALMLSDGIVTLTGGFGPRGVMLGIFILTGVLTAFMSNAAAAVLIAPIAIQTAYSQAVDPHAYVMGVALAASCAFVTPIGHQVCILVYGPGGYRFSDFTRVGVPLTILIWLLMLVFLPVFWPF
ncbi:MAG: anion permease [Anaerolineales bacterium]|nr:anion permease [Anaerolineales bacterium]